jgi:hypothetical protein
MLSPQNFTYNNCVPYHINLDPGEYQLEVWGAKGGSYSTSLYGGNGGYAKGTVTLNEKTDVYIYIGAAGSNYSYTHSCNGGGVGAGSNGKSGGGATDIRINSNSLLSRIIVAGGGGGSGDAGGDYGGVGGGINGGDGQNDGGSGAGGTQNVPTRYCIGGSTNCPKGDFGYGANATCSGSGAGGGGWYGGSASYNNEGGGGGSGYVLTSSSVKPAGYLLNNAKYFLRNTVLLDGSQRFPATDKKGDETGHTGDGYAIITPIIIVPQRTPLPTMLSAPHYLDFSFNNSNGKPVSDIGAQFSFSSSGIYNSRIKPGKYIFYANGSQCGKSVMIEHNFLSAGDMTVNISSDIAITMSNSVFLQVPGYMSSTPQFISKGSKIIFSDDFANYNCTRTEYSSLIITYQLYGGKTCKFYRSSFLFNVIATLILS